MPEISSEISAERAALAAEFRRLLVDTHWPGKVTIVSGVEDLIPHFIKSLDTKARNHHTKTGNVIKAPDRKTVTNWLRGITPMREHFLMPMADLFFPERERNAGQQAAHGRFTALWNAAAQIGRAPLGRNPSQTPLWAPSEPLHGIKGLVEMLVYPPGVEYRSGPLPLRVSISFGLLQINLGTKIIECGLRECRLIPVYENCWPTPGSRVGEATASPQYCRLEAGVWVITGPQDDRGDLSGWVLNGDSLCEVDYHDHPDARVSLRLVAPAGALNFTASDLNASLSNARAKVAKTLLLKNVQRDAMQNLILAEGGVHRRGL